LTIIKMGQLLERLFRLPYAFLKMCRHKLILAQSATQQCHSRCGDPRDVCREQVDAGISRWPPEFAIAVIDVHAQRLALYPDDALCHEHVIGLPNESAIIQEPDIQRQAWDSCFDLEHQRLQDQAEQQGAQRVALLDSG
jgi:hypothetical protein